MKWQCQTCPRAAVGPRRSFPFKISPSHIHTQPVPRCYLILTEEVGVSIQGYRGCRVLSRHRDEGCCAARTPVLASAQQNNLKNVPEMAGAAKTAGGSCFAAVLGSQEQQLAMILPHRRSVHPQVLNIIWRKKLSNKQGRRVGWRMDTTGNINPTKAGPLLHLSERAIRS